MSERRPVRPGRARPRRSRARGGSGAGPGVCRMPTGPRGPGWWSSSHRQCHGNGATTKRGDVEGGCYTPRGMGLGEADTRAKLIDPALHARGWTEDLIRREVDAAPVIIDDGRARRAPHGGRMDYVLRVIVQPDSQPVAVAYVEAKPEDLPPGHGLEQCKRYAACLNVPFVFATNGHQYVEYDVRSGTT